MISQEKWMILTPWQKLPKILDDLGKLIVAKGLEKLPKVKKIAQSGHTGYKFTQMKQKVKCWLEISPPRSLVFKK